MTTPLWNNHQNEKIYPTLIKNKKADVCIIGGGIAGLLIAYQLLNSGRKVILLEAKK